MSSTDSFISIPAGLLTKRQRRALFVEQPSVVPEYLDTKQLAAALNVSTRTIDKWRETRAIPFLKLGYIIRFDLASVKRALEQHIVSAK